MSEQQTLFGLTDFERFVCNELISSEVAQDFILVDFEIMQRNDARLKDKTPGDVMAAVSRLLKDGDIRLDGDTLRRIPNAQLD